MRQITATRRCVDARLEVRTHAGESLFSVGGRWDRVLRRYLADEIEPHVVELTEAQEDAGRAFAQWLAASERDDPDRWVLMMLAGDRGSGKTWFLAGVALTAIALKWPGEYQFAVNITTPQRRECIESIDEVAAPGWFSHGADLRDLWSVCFNGARIGWLSSRNPKRLRQAKLRIRHVLINEGQDQPERIYVNALGATRNVDGLTTIATNRPQEEAGDWVAVAADGIDAGEIRGRLCMLDPRLNPYVNDVALSKRADAIRVVSREAAAADMGGGAMRIAGPQVFPAFSPLPSERGGHVGRPPEVGWVDVTRELTASKMPDGSGWDFIVGVDFQRRPGIIGHAARVLRSDDGRLVLIVEHAIMTSGDERSFSDYLYRAGYSPNGVGPDGQQTASALIIGDGTGARQNAQHRWELPTSFHALRAEGWVVAPPCWTRKRKADNPLVKESRAQVDALLKARQILFHPRLKEADEGFPSLVDSMRRAKVTPRGGLVERGGWQHGPDGVRYLAWWVFPHPEPVRPPSTSDRKTFDAVRSIRILQS